MFFLSKCILFFRKILDCHQGAKLLAFRDTQKHCWKAIFLTWISDWKPYKNQGFGKPKLTQGFPGNFGQPN